jgi:thiamine kinase-like enzyme
MLTPLQLASYLIHHRFIEKRVLVNGKLEIFDASQRNCNYKVYSNPGTGFFVKQGLIPKARITVAHEAAIYQLFNSTSSTSRPLPLRRHILAYHHFDPDESLLILQLVDGTDLREYQANRSRFSAGVAGAIARAVARLHTSTGGIRERLNQLELDLRFKPWALSIDLPSLEIWNELSRSNYAMLHIIQSKHGFSEHLGALSREWRSDTFIHGDLKWENLLVPGVSPSRKTVMFADWEVAGLGDQSWDIGSIFAAYLRSWLRSIPRIGGSNFTEFASLAKVPLEAVKPAVRAFWSIYTRLVKLDPDEACILLKRSVKMSAVRLIQAAIEEQQSLVNLSGNGLGLLQLSLNILERPDEAIVGLLGLRRSIHE